MRLAGEVSLWFTPVGLFLSVFPLGRCNLIPGRFDIGACLRYSFTKRVPMSVQSLMIGASRWALSPCLYVFICFAYSLSGFVP